MYDVGCVCVCGDGVCVHKTEPVLGVPMLSADDVVNVVCQGDHKVCFLDS